MEESSKSSAAAPLPNIVRVKEKPAVGSTKLLLAHVTLYCTFPLTPAFVMPIDVLGAKPAKSWFT